MNKFCSNCGKELKEGADTCLNCGVLIKTATNTTSFQKTSISSNGGSILALVSGIIIVLKTLSAFSHIKNIESQIDENALFSGLEYSSNFIIWFNIAIFLCLIPSLIGLKVSKSGFNKTKSKVSAVGITINSIAIIMSIILFIYVIMLF